MTETSPFFFFFFTFKRSWSLFCDHDMCFAELTARFGFFGVVKSVIHSSGLSTSLCFLLDKRKYNDRSK